ncbi:uncharacterized protein FOMMEDRAFT_151241 [Fomitiporia mediterranea MF3/22]|uniref:uncharacterized protein n=1 Tax=Fomitiporia mediterranea (strain MF3/22) TaxID=694068 RepID=UPI0004408F20|nr:uncharacterized protein FOMMEDRAFT_151241 [Fomitiporia mediterranea MF3/22]EJD08391.1 hypothetical protein FOMMEDRAFT_151241 [Fomitiporia mediterranea MF3/22]
MLNDFFNVSIHSHTSRSVVQATVDKRALATIPTYDHSYGTTLSSTLSTPRAFTFLSAADNTISNRSSGPPLTPPEQSPSIHSTLPSLFEPPESTHSTLRISTCMHHSHSLHAVAVRAASTSTTRSTSTPTHTHNLTHRSRATTKRGDEDYIKRPKDAFILFRHEFCSRKNKAEAASGAIGCSFGHVFRLLTHVAEHLCNLLVLSTTLFVLSTTLFRLARAVAQVCLRELLRVAVPWDK